MRRVWQSNIIPAVTSMQNSSSCLYCSRKFNRVDNMKRHMKSQHGWDNKKSVDNNKMDLLLAKPSDTFTLRHPFTMMVAASTGGGKTWFIKSLIENRKRWISPMPERIIWIYGQWQPLYAELQKTTPLIEFVKGIPANIDQDEFLNPGMQNLIVLDDLMAEASNDKRICNLFTKGSQHRNLSVICIVQNLYYQGKESRTISLNSQYLVLFNNPRDQKQVMVLARQMYPGHSEQFLSTYRAATSKPFGYLLIDLKPDTPNDKRLWPNVFKQKNWHALPKGGNEQPYFHYLEQNRDEEQENWTPFKSTGIQHELKTEHKTRPGESCRDCFTMVHEDAKTDQEFHYPRYKEDVLMLPSQSSEKNPCVNNYSMASNIVARASCDECGVLFETISDLQRHVREWCHEGPLSKMPRLEIEDSEEENGDSAFIEMANEVKEETEDRFNVHIAKYEADGFTKENARKEAELMMLTGNRQIMYKRYQTFIKSIFEFHQSKLHRSIIKDIREELEKSGDPIRAIKYVTRKRKSEITDFLEITTPDGSDKSESELESGEDDGDEDNNEFNEKNVTISSGNATSNNNPFYGAYNKYLI